AAAAGTGAEAAAKESAGAAAGGGSMAPAIEGGGAAGPNFLVGSAGAEGEQRLLSAAKRRTDTAADAGPPAHAPPASVEPSGAQGPGQVEEEESGGGRTSEPQPSGAPSGAPNGEASGASAAGHASCFAGGEPECAGARTGSSSAAVVAGEAGATPMDVEDAESPSEAGAGIDDTLQEALAADDAAALAGTTWENGGPAAAAGVPAALSATTASIAAKMEPGAIEGSESASAASATAGQVAAAPAAAEGTAPPQATPLTETAGGPASGATDGRTPPPAVLPDDGAVPSSDGGPSTASARGQPAAVQAAAGHIAPSPGGASAGSASLPATDGTVGGAAAGGVAPATDAVVMADVLPPGAVGDSSAAQSDASAAAAAAAGGPSSSSELEAEPLAVSPEATPLWEPFRGAGSMRRPQWAQPRRRAMFALDAPPALTTQSPIVTARINEQAQARLNTRAAEDRARWVSGAIAPPAPGVMAWWQFRDAAARASALHADPRARDRAARELQEVLKQRRGVQERLHTMLSRKQRVVLPPLRMEARRKGHWDYLLDEMRHTATDFDEERKWKRHVAANFALLAAQHHAAVRLGAPAVQDAKIGALVDAIEGPGISSAVPGTAALGSNGAAAGTAPFDAAMASAASARPLGGAAAFMAGHAGASPPYEELKVMEHAVNEALKSAQTLVRASWTDSEGRDGLAAIQSCADVNTVMAAAIATTAAQGAIHCQAPLRPSQARTLVWCRAMNDIGCTAVLAEPAGTGKTVTMVSALGLAAAERHALAEAAATAAIVAARTAAVELATAGAAEAEARRAEYDANMTAATAAAEAQA
ncbi:unnamed protein product, partial [Phaeothamnion confervicola]